MSNQDFLEKLKSAARRYFELGCAIVPMKGKEPLCKWSHWQEKTQTESEFESLDWSQSTGFSIICGQKLKNGLFIGAIDFDVKNLPEETVEIGKRALKFLPITQMEETPSGGLHLIYFSRKKPSSVSAYHNECGLELVGENKLLIMAPSQGYRRLNDNSPTEVEDLEELFYSALEKVGVKVEKVAKAWFDKPELNLEPYRGSDPPCIKALLKGTHEGLRNEFAIRLASYFINFKQYNPVTVREKILKQWNRLNSPPLPWQELDNVVRSAIRGKYVFGCSDSILSKFCNREQCPICPKEERIVFDEETIEKARQLLKDPAFFYKLGKVFDYGFHVPKIDKPRFVIEEERNKRLLGFLLLGAAKLGMTSLIKVLGEPGTAKDSMVRMWLQLLPLNSCERSFFTAATLRYSEELQEADLLYIPDSPELKGEKGRHLRFMRADDGGLISEYALKDPETGEMTTKTVTLPVKGIVTTSNFVTGDTALESGMWTLHTNGSPELTKKVKKEKLKFRAGKRPLFPEEELKVWKCAFHLLLTEEPMDDLPTIPYAENLGQLLESERSESRRDPDKLCDLISLIAWVRRFQKPKEKWHEADFIDLYIALQLGLDAITQSISDLDQKEQQIYNVVRKAIAGEEDVTVRYVSNETGIPYKTCYRLLEKLVDKGFITKDTKRGRNVYAVLSGKEPKQLLIVEGRNLDGPEQLMEYVLRLTGDFSPSHQPIGEGGRIVDPLTGQILTVEWNDGKPTIHVESCCEVYPPSIPDEKVRSSERGMETTLNSEKKAKELLPQTMRSFNKPIKQEEREALKEMFECPYCKNVGKPTFFGSKHDLEVHILRLHSGQPLTKIRKSLGS